MKLQYFAKISLLMGFFAFSTAGPITTDNDDGKLLEKGREIHSFMNESADPCEDFYEFACGNWNKIHPAVGETTETNYLLVLKEAYDKRVAAMLQDMSDPADTEIDKKVKRYYKSCLKLMHDGIDSKKFFALLSEFGDMPVLTGSNWNESEFDWVETLAKILRKYGYQIMMGLEISADLHDNKKYQVYIGEVKYDLESKSVYLDPSGAHYRDLYKDGISIKLQNLLDIDGDTATKAAEEIVAFEVLLARGLTDSKSDTSLSSKMFSTTVEKLHEKYAPTFDVKKYFQVTFGMIPNGMIYEYSPQFLENLVDTVKQTDKRIIANYIFYHLINKFFVESGKPEEEIENYCLEKMNEKFAKNVDNIMYRRFGDNKAIEDDIQRIWNEMKKLFTAKLRTSSDLDWMSSEVRQKAIEKLELLKLEINSYMDFNFNEELDELETSEDDFIGNLQKITMLKAKHDIRIEKLNEPVKPIDASEELSFTPANILMENAVKVPVALLKPYSVWAADFPDALKFGMLGYLLGHELVHTFDENGRQFGAHGNLEDWWDQQSMHNFEERRACFRDQYHSYSYGGSPLPLSESQGENIADNSGLQLAYDAYVQARNNAGESTDEIPGLPYKGKKLFFIGFGQFWCNDVQEDYRKLQAQTDEHTPARFRTIGVVSNFKEFAETFECEAGDIMNPATKCALY